MSRLIDAGKLKENITQYQGYVIETINGDVSITVDDALELINKQSTVEINQWIPCSERLPNIRKYKTGGPIEYNVMIKDAEVPTTLFINDNDQWLDYYGVYNCSDYTSYKVIAWQSLPEPYKEETNEQ